MDKALIFVFMLIAQTMQIGVTAAPNPSSGGGPTITVTSAVCVGNATSATANCTLGASGAVGDLLIVRSKTASTLSAFVTFTFSVTASCATLTPIVAETFQTNGGGQFTVAEVGCIITTGGANTPIATWAGGTASFTDIEAFTVHTTNTWKTSFVDQAASNIGATTSTSCTTGTTSATTNANDFILATCDVFNAGQTWGTLAGFTQYAAASRNTAGIYYQSVTSTGTQTATVPLSATDFGVGMIAALASN